MTDERTKYVRNTPVRGAGEPAVQDKDARTTHNPLRPPATEARAEAAGQPSASMGSEHTVYRRNPGASGTADLSNPYQGSVSSTSETVRAPVWMPDASGVPMIDNRGVCTSRDRTARGLLLAVDRTAMFVLYEGTNRIGRRETDDYRLHVLLPDPDVSLRQGSILWSDDEILLRTIGDETNATVVNGKPVHRESLVLKPGDRITFGNRTFELLIFG